MWRVARFFLVAALAAMLFSTAAHAQSDEADGQDPCRATGAIQFDLIEPFWSGDLAKSQSVCFVLEMTQGSFARLRLTIEGRGFFIASVLAPTDTTPTAQVSAESAGTKETVLAWSAVASGNYLVRVESPGYGPGAQGVRVQLESLESPELYAARARAVATDPRIRSLSNHMLKLNSIDPEDDDFSDLMPLRDLLKGVRIVLLGEAEHGDGTDFLAKTRLIRYLHSELGFDVLAFESGLYNMSQAWEALRAGEDPHEAFSKGAFYIWANSAQVEPLVRYVSHSLTTDRPLELAGVDNQISASSPELTLDLREFLKGKDIATPFANPNTPESEILAALSEFLFFGSPPKQARPDSTMSVRFVESLVRTVDEIGNIEPTREAMFWQRILEAMEPYAREVFRLVDLSEGDLRDQEMANNLIWMAKKYYPDRKIIVWAASPHTMRAPSELRADPIGMQATLGDGVWKVFGKEMYSIALVSYEGKYRWAGQRTKFTVVPDQDPEAEFEELMAATGQTAAFVDLRQANEHARWLGGSFVARPLGHISTRAVWSHHFDAFLFLRTQEPSEARKD